MAEARVERRLAAILAADVAGYSRLMGVDEEGTLAALKACRRELIDPKIAEHRGRLVKTTGDGALVEFASAVDATHCAMEIQRAMAERNADVPDDRRIEFRIGINVGDIIIDEGDIYGDGVNIAARIETLASPGAICLSDNADQQIKGKVTLDVSDLGELRLKNIAQPVRVFSVRDRNSTADPTLALPDGPSIAVLPFVNIGGDPEHEYFADGMAEEIITALSRCSWLFVIARNSSFSYKGKAVDVRRIGRELGVRYVLEGSVRRGGKRVRFTGQLIDATVGASIWAERFDGEISDVFDLQDQFAESVVAAIEPKLQLAEISRLKVKPPGNLDAYELVLRAQQLLYEFTDESITAALACLNQALAIDPVYAQAMALAAYCYAERRLQGWTHDLPSEIAAGIRMALRAAELGIENGNVLWMAGFAIWHLALDAQRASDLAYRSLRLNPNSASAMATAAWIDATAGESAKALALFERAERLSPRDPRGWVIAIGIATVHMAEGRFDKALSFTEKALVENPRSAVALRMLAASNAQLGKMDQATAALQEALKFDPQLTVSRMRSRLPFMAEKLWSGYSSGLRLAGLPD